MYSFSSLLSDATNFIRNGWKVIFTITILFLLANAFISEWSMPSEQAVVALLNRFNLSSFNDIALILNYPETQIMAFASDFLHLFKNYLIASFLFSILTLALFPTVIASLLNNTLQARFFFSLLTRNILSILLFIITLTAFTVFFSFVLTLFMPLMYVAILVVFILTLLFQTLLIAKPELSFWKKFKHCFRFFKQEAKLISLIIGLYILFYFLIHFLIGFVSSSVFALFIIDFCVLLANQFVLVYLFRLYQLSFNAAHSTKMQDPNNTTLVQ